MGRFGRTACLLAAAGLGLSSWHGATARPQVAPTIEGKWQGDFGAGPWTFEFVKKDGAWSGRYTHPKYSGWNKMAKLQGTDTSVKFSIDAKPSMDFKMKLDRSRTSMSGDLVVGPSLKEKSPLTVPFVLKRTN